MALAACGWFAATIAIYIAFQFPVTYKLDLDLPWYLGTYASILVSASLALVPAVSMLLLGLSRGPEHALAVARAALYTLGLFISLYALVITFSRGGMLGLAVGCAFAVALLAAPRGMLLARVGELLLHGAQLAHLDGIVALAEDAHTVAAGRGRVEEDDVVFLLRRRRLDSEGVSQHRRCELGSDRPRQRSTPGTRDRALLVESSVRGRVARGDDVGAEEAAEATIAAAEQALRDDFQPLTDVRGTAAYRIEAAAALLWRLWLGEQGEVVSVLGVEAC